MILNSSLVQSPIPRPRSNLPPPSSSSLTHSSVHGLASLLDANIGRMERSQGYERDAERLEGVVREVCRSIESLYIIPLSDQSHGIESGECSEGKGENCDYCCVILLLLWCLSILPCSLWLLQSHLLAQLVLLLLSLFPFLVLVHRLSLITLLPLPLLPLSPPLPDYKWPLKLLVSKKIFVSPNYTGSLSLLALYPWSCSIEEPRIWCSERMSGTDGTENSCRRSRRANGNVRGAPSELASKRYGREKFPSRPRLLMSTVVMYRLQATISLCHRHAPPCRGLLCIYSILSLKLLKIYLNESW